MRHTIAFPATDFNVAPVQVEVPDGVEAPEEGSLPVALLAFQSGQSVVVTMLIGTEFAEGLMNAFTQAEPHRANMPEGIGQWEPEGVSIPGGLFWQVNLDQVVNAAVTPPHETPEGIVPHWTLTLDDAEGSQVHLGVSDAMCVQIIRTLAQIAHGELEVPEVEDEGDGEEAQEG